MSQMDSSARLAVGAIAVILAVLIPGAVAAQSQFIDCSGASGSNDYQVYLNELAYAKASLEEDPALERLMRRLSFKLGSNIEAITLERIPVPLAFAFCEDRSPSSAAQFSESLLQGLDDDSVILELWGQLDAKDEDGVVSERRATIGYVLIPVLIEDYDEHRPTGFQFVEYPRDEAASGELIDLLQQSVELEAFVAAGVGVNLMRNDQHYEALSYLCRAKILLEERPVGIKENQRIALISYLADKARETVEQTGAAGGDSGGLAELMGPDDPCPHGGQ